MAQGIEARLAELGITLAEPSKPLASYVGYVSHQGTVFISGQLPLQDGALAQTGLLGKEVSLEQGVAAARLCAINVLCQVKAACVGDLERIERCIKLTGYVASTPEFTDQHKVINGASDLMGEVLGERGIHARAAVGMASLPMNASVEVDAIFAIR